MFDIVIIGTGPSSYAFLKGMEKSGKFNDKKIALISSNKTKSEIKTVNINNVTPKFLQTNNLESLSYYLSTFGDTILDNFSHVGVHGIGGMSRIWGGSIGTLNKQASNKNNIDYNEIKNIFYELASFLPYKGNILDDLYSNFDLPITSSIKISNKISKLFGDYHNLKIGSPRLLVKDSCNNCNQCLIGCESDSVWYPTLNDFYNIQNINLQIIDDSFALGLTNSSVIIENQNKISELKANLIVLGCGSLQNYKLLTSLEHISDKKAKVLTTPAIAFAFFDFTKNTNDDFFGMGNASFAIKQNQENIFYGNFYDGYSLSLSKGKVFSKNTLIDNLTKIVAKYMVAGAGFMSSDNADCTIEALKDGKISIKGSFNNRYLETYNTIMNELKKFAKEKQTIIAHKKQAIPGADIHYGGAVPNELLDKNLIPDGKLKNLDNILVIGGSTFSYLPPESPTLSYMANSYRIGKNCI